MKRRAPLTAKSAGDSADFQLQNQREERQWPNSVISRFSPISRTSSLISTSGCSNERDVPHQERLGPSSDGEVNLAILNATDPKEPGHQPCLYHFGFHVEDNKETARRIQEIYPEGAPKEREATYAEGRGSDPDGNLFDISTVGWGGKRRMDL
jgi:hypothetical protein